MEREPLDPVRGPGTSDEPRRWSRGRVLSIAAAVAAFAAVELLPSGLHHVEGFGQRPAHAAAVAAAMAVLWLTEALPIHWTACLPLLLFPVLGLFGRGPAGDAWSTAQPYFDAYIFLFLGGMAIGAAMEQTGLHRRVALRVLQAVGTDPRQLLLGMLIATAAVSMWISNTATAVMMVPIAVALLKQMEHASGKRAGAFGTSLMLAVAYASNVGGIASKIGTGTNSIFTGFVSETMEREIGFLEYITLAAPFAVLFIPVIWLVLWRLGRTADFGAEASAAVLRREIAALGPMRGGERIVAGVFAGAGLLWVLGDPLRPLIAPLVPIPWEGFKFVAKHYEAGVSVLAALALIALRSLSWAAFRAMPWSALLLLGGSFALASGIEGSGLSQWLARSLAVLATMSLPAQLMIAVSASIALSAIASNTATVNVMLNILPRSLPVLFATAMASSCDFALPAGTPPNAIVFGSGYVRLPTMMRTGVVLDVLAAVLLTLYALWWIAPLTAS
jgi:solute carrier family 13 (sodium-dependent dicarboxylate transporter), member 2/3/5